MKFLYSQLVVVLCFCSSCSSSNTDSVQTRSPFVSTSQEKTIENCESMGFSDEDVCDVSMVGIISNPHGMDGKLVRVRGYFVPSVGGVNYGLLYFSQESYEFGDSSSAIRIDKLSNNVPSDLRQPFEDMLTSKPKALAIIGRLKSKEMHKRGDYFSASLVEIIGVTATFKIDYPQRTE